MQQAINHPHAFVAIQLAEIGRPARASVNLVLHKTGAPRSLYTLARVLRSAQLLDESTEIDRINAAHPAIVANAA